MADTEIARRIKEVRAKRKSPDVNTIEHWIRENFDELDRERKSGEASFKDIAQVAIELGIKGMRGNRNPSGAVVGKYFARIALENREGKKR